MFLKCTSVIILSILQLLSAARYITLIFNRKTKHKILELLWIRAISTGRYLLVDFVIMPSTAVTYMETIIFGEKNLHQVPPIENNHEPMDHFIYRNKKYFVIALKLWSQIYYSYFESMIFFISTFLHLHYRIRSILGFCLTIHFRNNIGPVRQTVFPRPQKTTNVWPALVLTPSLW